LGKRRRSEYRGRAPVEGIGRGNAVSGKTLSKGKTKELSSDHGRERKEARLSIHDNRERRGYTVCWWENPLKKGCKC